MPHAGELAALGAAFLWSASAVPFTYVSRRAGPIAVNSYKTTVATCLLTVAACVGYGPAAFARGSSGHYLYLALSGVVGLSITDTLLFHGYRTIGPRLSFILFSFNPFVAALASWPLLGERLGWLGLAGMTVTVGGILLVVLERSPDGRRPRGPGFGAGVLCDSLAALGMGLAGLFAKLGLAQNHMPLLAAHAFRMAAGALGLLAAGGAIRALGRWAAALGNRRALAAASLGTLCGPTLGVLFFLWGIHLTETGIAMTLAATTPVLVIPFTWIFHGDRPTARALVGALVAILGIALLFLR